MENETNNTSTTDSQRRTLNSIINNIDWYAIANISSLAAKGLIVLSVLGIAVTFTIKYLLMPYNVFISCIWTGLGVWVISSMLRNKSGWITKPYNVATIKHQDSQLILLLTNIHVDIKRYQAAAYANYLSVRTFKHITLLLSAVSTIVLGLNIDNLFPAIKNDWHFYSKNIALIIGAMIAAYSALMSYWNTEKYWLINKSIANKLIALKYEIEDMDKKQKISANDIEEKVLDYQNIKADFFKYWEGALSGKGAQNAQAEK
jgi:hypothetical protein